MAMVRVQQSRRPAQDLRVVFVTDGVAADALVPQWDDLVARAGSTPWATPAWGLGWWRAAPRSVRLRLVAVFDGDELVAVGPFCEVGPPGLRLVRFLGDDHQPNRVLTAPGRTAAASAVWAALRQHGSALDLYCLEDRQGSGYRQLVEDPRWRLSDEPSDSCVSIVPGGAAEEYLATRTDLVKDMRRISRRLARDGHVLEVARASTPDQVGILLPEVAAVAAAAQRDRWKPGDLESLARGEVPGPLASMLRAGRLRLSLVRIDGRPAAFALELVGAGVVSGAVMAYDTEWQPYAPGRRAMEEGFRWAIDDGAREYDLGPGLGAYKSRWSDHEYQTRRVVAAPTAGELRVARAGLSLRAAVKARPTRRLRGSDPSPVPEVPAGG